MSSKPEIELSSGTQRRIAALAGCDVRSVKKALEHGRIRGTTGYRIRDVLQREGLTKEAAALNELLAHPKPKPEPETSAD